MDACGINQHQTFCHRKLSEVDPGITGINELIPHQIHLQDDTWTIQRNVELICQQVTQPISSQTCLQTGLPIDCQSHPWVHLCVDQPNPQQKLQQVILGSNQLNFCRISHQLTNKAMLSHKMSSCVSCCKSCQCPGRAICGSVHLGTA